MKSTQEMENTEQSDANKLDSHYFFQANILQSKKTTKKQRQRKIKVKLCQFLNNKFSFLGSIPTSLSFWHKV